MFCLKAERMFWETTELSSSNNILGQVVDWFDTKGVSPW